jgi:aminomethyltransferase
VKVWDAIAASGRQFDLHPTGMLALDVARVEAGLLLLDVDYTSSRKALIPSQKYSPYELGFGKMVHLQKDNFIGRAALVKDEKNGVDRQLVGLELDWLEIEALYEKLGLTPAAPSQASRVHVPVYAGNRQVGKATSTTWSPVLKKMIVLATVETAHSQPGKEGGSGVGPEPTARQCCLLLYCRGTLTSAVGSGDFLEGRDGISEKRFQGQEA